MLLLEALLLAGITALMAGLLFPALSDWTEERRLDMAASEAAAIIRTVQADARNGDARYPGTSLEYKELTFKCKTDESDTSAGEDFSPRLPPGTCRRASRYHPPP